MERFIIWKSLSHRAGFAKDKDRGLNKTQNCLESIRLALPHPLSHSQRLYPLYLKTREIDRHPLDARHRGEARVISLMKRLKLESSVGT